MIIYSKAGTQIADITPSDQSTRTRKPTSATIDLIFEHPGYINFPVGSYITHNGTRYTLRRPGTFVKNGTRMYEYTLSLISQPGPDKYKARDITTKRLKFSLTARPEEFLQFIVDNLNERETGWTVGVYLNAKEKSVQFSHNTISEALTAIAEAFDTEFEIVNKAINLRKVEYNKSNPVALSYGGGNGFKTGVRRENFDSSVPVEILQVQGGERNIDASAYGAKELLLPISQTIWYDGTFFEDEEGFQPSLARTYTTDSYGLSIRRSDIELDTMEENSIDLSDIYPARIGAVTSVVEVSAENNAYDIIDSAIPNDLNFDDCLIPGETMTIKFESGMLVGQEFECNYAHATRRFEIIAQEIDGQTMPNAVFCPVIGDQYIILGIQLPAAYICDNVSKTGASWDLFREGVRNKYENEDSRFTFSGDLDPIWYREQFGTIGARIVPGGYISFTDTQFQTTAVLIRIAAVKDFLNNPYKCTLDLSNVAVGSGNVRSDLAKISTGEVKAAERTRDSVRFFKRRFRDASETMAMLQSSLLNFSGAINPITVQTMQTIVGDQALQFRFVNSKTTPVRHAFTFDYDVNTKSFSSMGDILQHMTLGITTVSSVRTVSAYHFWDIAEYSGPELTDPTKAYFIYAKCAAAGTTGQIVMSEVAIGINAVANYYHFLIGVLNSEFENDRSFVPLYGFTEILPGQITTNRIQSDDAEMFIDLQGGGSARIGDASSYIDFNNEQAGTFVFKNVKIKSLSGTTYNVLIDRGEWNSAAVYYIGEVAQDGGSSWVSLTDNNQNHKPAVGIYWRLYAAKGADGNSVKIKGHVTEWVDLPQDPADGDAWVTDDTGHLWSYDTVTGWTDVGLFQGEKGEAGEAAKYVRVTGPSEFIKQAGAYAPESVVLTAHLFNLVSNYQWQYYNNYTSAWTNLTGQTNQTVTITPDQSAWDYAGNTLRVRCLSNTDYYDEITISRVSDGDGAAHVILSQETRNIACIPDGTPKTGQLPIVITAKTMIGATLADNDGNTWSASGITYTKNDDGAGTTTITITEVTGLTGYIEMTFTMIPPTGSGIDITKRFTVNKTLDGTDGATGPRGASAVTRGTYRADKQYTGNTNRRDVVRYFTGGAWGWYIIKATAGTITNILPTNTTYWETAGAEFESIATDLLLASGANIAGFIFIPDPNDETTGAMISQSGFAYNSSTGLWYESTDIEANLFVPKIKIDAANKNIQTNSLVVKYAETGTTYNTIGRLSMDNTVGQFRAYEPYNTGEAYFGSNGAGINNAGIMETIDDDNGNEHHILAGNVVNALTLIDAGVAEYVAGFLGRVLPRNTGGAPAYGGVFFSLMAAGLFLRPRTVNNSAVPIQLNREDAFVTCYNTSSVTLNLPENPQPGQHIIFKKIGSGDMILNAGSRYIFRYSAVHTLGIGEIGRAVTVVWDGIYWSTLLHTI